MANKLRNSFEETNSEDVTGTTHKKAAAMNEQQYLRAPHQHLVVAANGKNHPFDGSKLTNSFRMGFHFGHNLTCLQADKR